jgi:hypothetical protein
VSHTFPSLVLSEGEEEDDANHNAEDVTAAADNNDNDDNDNDNDSTSMPPKVKPMATAATKTAKKKTKKADEITHLPARKLPNIRTFSIKVEDPLTISYYAKGKHDYTNVVFCVNGTIEYGEYKVRMAKDGRLILLVQAIHVKLIDKVILKKIFGHHYHKGSARIIAWDNMVQEMEGEKVHPKNGLYWRMPQVGYLKWKCTGTPIAIDKLGYPRPLHIV